MAGKHRGQQSEREYALDLQDRRVRLSEQRERRFAEAQTRRAAREDRQAAEAGEEAAAASRQARRDRAATAAAAPGRLARQAVAYSGRGALEAELIAGLVLIAIRIVAEYEPSSQGPQYKGTVVPPRGQLGPLSVFAGLLASFFGLSLLAQGGGTRAKIAVLLGLCIILTLGVRSTADIQKVAQQFGGGLKTPATVATDAAYTSESSLQEEEYGPTGTAGVTAT